MTNPVNPLLKYYRTPGISVKLPSMGRFQDEGNVSFTATGDVPVLPMRAADEMLMKSPDALMSGLALEETIKSCCPSIKDPAQLPTPDVDVLLLAIRAATYGNNMTVDADCPKCETENEYEFDVATILETITPLEDEYVVRLSDELTVYLRPFTFRINTQASTLVFHETRKLQLLDSQEIKPSVEQRQIIVNHSYKSLNDMNIQMVAECVERVITPEGPVTDKKHIQDFVNNIEQGWVAKLEDVLKKINDSGVNKHHNVTCNKCKHEWETIVEFDPTTFFARSS